MNKFDKWVEIDLKKIAHNVREIKRNLNKNTLFMAVVKADAYGHGVEEVSKIALANGADWLCVTDQLEGEKLRKLNFEVPIFVLSPPPLDTAEIIVENDLVQGVDSLEQVKALNILAKKWSKRVTVHIKVDTGLGRFGILPDEVLNFSKKVSKFSNIKLQGVYTHFASPYNDLAYTQHQYGKFKEVKEELEKNNIHIEMYHCAGSPAAMHSPQMQMDAVRIGLSLCFRYNSLKKTNQWNLVDCISLKTRVRSIKKIPPGGHIGYNNLFISKREMIIAVIPIGYADGIPTSLANKGQVLIKGEILPIIGSVCMSHIFVDVTEFSSTVNVGDEVVVIGNQEKETLTCRDISSKVNIKDAEIVINICRALPRIFIT